MSEWRDISTAPRDGTEFLAYGFYVYPDDEHPTQYYMIVEYSGDPEWPWESFEGKHHIEFFSHWMPLPEPPTPSKHTEGA